MPKRNEHTTAVLEASHLSHKTPDGKVLFDALSFEVHAGQLLLITGPNGSGKSTLLKMLLRQLPPGNGLVRTTVPPERIAYIPQLQNMEFHLPLHLRDVIEISHNGPVAEDRITHFGLLHREHLDLTWNTASGGERQRTLLTSSLLESPQLLFLDEPMNHLDRESQERMLNAIVTFLDAQSTGGRAAVLVSHLGAPQLEKLGHRLVRVEFSSPSKGGK